METPSLEGLPTKAKENPSPHEMRLSSAGHQPSISWSWGHFYYHFFYLGLSDIIFIIFIIIMAIIIVINMLFLLILLVYITRSSGRA